MFAGSKEDFERTFAMANWSGSDEEAEEEKEELVETVIVSMGTIVDSSLV